MRSQYICEFCGAAFAGFANRRRHGRCRFCSKYCAYQFRHTTPSSILGKNLDRSGDPDACWPYTGKTFHNGYGIITINRERRTLASYAHRVAYEAAHGPIPDRLSVLHRCDNPPCCNPAHLFLGTQADNMADKVIKGRQARGSQHGMAKLTEDDVRAIRAEYATNGVLQYTLAKRYGVGADTIGLAIRRKTWKHVL